MKNYLISGLCILSVVAPVVVLAQTDNSEIACLSLQNNFGYQSSDSNTNGEVSILQGALVSHGYLHASVTGYFGLLTLQAVKDFQNANGITSTGYVGILTRAKLNSLYGCNANMSEKNSSGVGSFVPLSQGWHGWYAVAAAPNGDAYAFVIDAQGFGKIYLQPGGNGNFSPISNTPSWCASGYGCTIAIAPNGDVYVAVQYGNRNGSGEIYVQKNGTGDFIAVHRNEVNWWEGIAAGTNGDVYAIDYMGAVWKRTNGIGDFVKLNQTLLGCHGTRGVLCLITVAPSGDVYIAQFAEDVYIKGAGANSFVSLHQGSKSWAGLAAAPNGDIYASNEYGPPTAHGSQGDIYVKRNGQNNFVALGETPRYWEGMGAAPNGNVYALEYGGDIYVRRNGVVATSTSVPTITSLSPIAGPTGTNVRISGTNFSMVSTTVHFGSIALHATSSSGTSLTFTVPDRAVARGYDVTVTTADGTSNGIDFTVTTSTARNIVSNLLFLSPTSGPAGSTVYLYGTNLPAFSTSTIRFGNYTRGIGPGCVSNSLTYLTCFIVPPVPSGVYPVAIVNGDGASNSVNFTVTGGNGGNY